MDNNILITDNSHNKIFQTYSELRKKLPPTFFKMKVFSTPKYNINKKPLLKKIENDKNSTIKKIDKPQSIDQFINGNKNIYILSNKTINLKKYRNLRPIHFNKDKYNEMMKKTLLTEKDNNNTEINEYINYDSIELPQNNECLPYYFHSNPIKDSNMKNNIYLPKIMDRMRNSIPRNERDKNGFLIEGLGVFSSNKVKYDELNDKYEININANAKQNNDNDRDYCQNENLN